MVKAGQNSSTGPVLPLPRGGCVCVCVCVCVHTHACAQGRLVVREQCEGVK